MSPVRTCIVCGKKAEQKSLKRYIWDGNGPVSDDEKKHHGRGAYCCNTEKCIGVFFKAGKKLERAFRLKIHGVFRHNREKENGSEE